MVMYSPPTASGSGSQASALPNPEVREKAQRRIYTAEYKLRILQETDNCNEGQIGWSFTGTARREKFLSANLIWK